MARLDDMAPSQRVTIEALECPEFKDTTLAGKRPLAECRVALISSAGLMRRGEDNVAGGTSEYRTFEKSCPDRDILINHVSVNFDRTAFAEDVNTVFPREVLKSLEEDGSIGHAAKKHYSLLGSIAPENFQATAEHLASELKEADINTVCLLPV